MNALLGLRVVFALGIVNFLILSALFLSCRCMGARKPFSRMLHVKAFARFYKLHCYYWWILFGSVVAHLTIAVRVLGIPFGT
jgi:hypothetical protein